MYEQVPDAKIALSPFWVEECDKRKERVDMAKYILDVTSVPEKKGQKAVKREKPGSESALNSPSKAPSQPQGPSDCESEEENIQRHIVVQRQPSGSSRSPSPPQHVEEYMPNKNSFTEADGDWFLRYIRHKLQQKPDMSRRALMDAVGDKV